MENNPFLFHKLIECFLCDETGKIIVLDEFEFESEKECPCCHGMGQLKRYQ